jgi:hypothetical protein
VIFDKLPKCRLAAERAAWTAQYVIAVWKETSQMSGREWRWDGQYMPDVLGGIQGGEL